MWRSGWITWQHRTLMHNFIMTIHTTSTAYFHGRGGGGERWSRSSTVDRGLELEGQLVKVKLVHGGGEEGMRKTSGVGLSATGGIQSWLTPTHHFDFEDAASNADRVSHASPSLQLSTDTDTAGLQEPLAAWVTLQRKVLQYPLPLFRSHRWLTPSCSLHCLSSAVSHASLQM